MKHIKDYIVEGLFDIEDNIGSATRTTWAIENITDSRGNAIQVSQVTETQYGLYIVLDDNQPSGACDFIVNKQPDFPLEFKCDSVVFHNVEDFTDITFKGTNKGRKIVINLENYKNSNIKMTNKTLTEVSGVNISRCNNCKIQLADSDSLSNISIMSCSKTDISGVSQLYRVSTWNQNKNVNFRNLKTVDELLYNKIYTKTEPVSFPDLKQCKTVRIQDAKLETLPDSVAICDELRTSGSKITNTTIFDSVQPSAHIVSYNDRFAQTDVCEFSGKLTLSGCPQINANNISQIFPKATLK